MLDVAVVGSGPNGLAAAVVLARGGLSVRVIEAADRPGGGLRTAESTRPGLVHDECAGFHPLTPGSRLDDEVGLSGLGVQWAVAPVQHAFPLDGGRGAAAYRDLDRTVAALGGAGAAYDRLFRPVVERFPDVADEFLRPVLHRPRHPVALAHLGLRAPWPSSWVSPVFRDDAARGLWAGLAAHAFRPLGAPLSSAVAVALGASAHHAGWPVAVGGSQRIAEALLTALADAGGRVETGRVVTDARDLGARTVVLDTSPTTAAGIASSLMDPATRRALASHRYGPGAFAVALAVEGGIPWAYPPAREAATVHVGGSFAEVAFAEREVAAGRMPARPFVLVGQQHVADPSRGRAGVVPVDCYAHVPNGWPGDVTELVLRRIERFAPGVRERIVATSRRGPAALEAANANFVGGDILTGLKTPGRMLLGPRPGPRAYRIGPRAYLCSAAVPPGPGAHGMCGYWAAKQVLRDLG